MQVVDYIIVGQGICGTVLSYYLQKAGKAIIVIDLPQTYTATKVASGVINPVTGRIMATTWFADELIPFAEKCYTAIGMDFQQLLVHKCNIISFPPTEQMKQAHEKRVKEQNAYVHASTNSNTYNQWFNFIHGVYTISPSLFIDLNQLLHTWRNHLLKTNLIIAERFNENLLQIDDHQVKYKNIIAQKIIYCDGTNSFRSPYWKNLPYTYNKGQALIVDIPQLPQNSIYKFGNISLVPWGENNWWAGSSYEREFNDKNPTIDFLTITSNYLQAYLKSPFTIQEHIAAIRPGVVERRPFVGLHPKYTSIGIFNGMGTKGCSLAPYFAKQFTDYLIHNENINPLVNVNRFAGILSK